MISHALGPRPGEFLMSHSIPRAIFGVIVFLWGRVCSLADSVSTLLVGPHGFKNEMGHLKNGRPRGQHPSDREKRGVWIYEADPLGRRIL